MPIYEFRCQDCAHAFEYLCPLNGEPSEGCPSCGSRRLSRLLSTFASPGVAGSGPSCSGCHSTKCDTCH